MSKINTSRRQFLKTSGSLSAAGAVSAPWLMNLAAMAEAHAADATDYKALVCIFLAGGNDACNTILPALNPKLAGTDNDPSWKRYNAVRSEIGVTSKFGETTRIVKHSDYAQSTPQDMALAQPTPVILSDWSNPSSKVYPLNSALAPLVPLYQNKHLAVVANVGIINTATTVDNYRLGQNIPMLLRSHNDQQVAWQSGRGPMEGRGWGGRFVDNTTFAAKSFPTVPDRANSFRSIVIGGNARFSMGDKVSPYGLARGIGVVPLLPDVPVGSKAFGVVSVDAIKKVITGDFKTPRTNLIERDYAKVIKNALNTQTYMSQMLSEASAVPAPTVNYRLAQDLHTVAKVIKSHAGRKGRQVFFLSLASFDTHSNQASHNALLAELAESMAYFQTALGTAAGQVVTFTASEFGRLLHQNGDGTDHGWGGHHFVMGESVLGGKIYGEVPSYEHTGTEYVDKQMSDDGALIPSISVQQFGAALGQWFVPPTDTSVAAVFNNTVPTSNPPENVTFL